MLKMAFKYDIVTLIELVEMRPCLWDKTIEVYKDKMQKQNAWNEIYKFLDDNYENLTSKQKKETGDKITTKWTYIKDAYLKSLKTKSAQGTKKDYIYASHLNFLLKCYKKETTENSMNSPRNVVSPVSEQDNNRDDTIYSPESEEITDVIQTPKPKRTKKITTSHIKPDNIEIEILEQLKNHKQQDSQTKKIDEEIFFQSFVPYLKDMTEEEKLELHFDILTSIKKIKLNRRQIQSDVIQSPVQPSSSSHYFLNNNRNNQLKQEWIEMSPELSQ